MTTLALRVTLTNIQALNFSSRGNISHLSRLWACQKNSKMSNLGHSKNCVGQISIHFHISLTMRNSLSHNIFSVTVAISCNNGSPSAICVTAKLSHRLSIMQYNVARIIIIVIIMPAIRDALPTHNTHIAHTGSQLHCHLNRYIASVCLFLSFSKMSDLK